METDVEMTPPNIACPPRRVPIQVWVPIIFGGFWQLIWLFLIMLLVSFVGTMFVGHYYSDGTHYTPITATNLRQHRLPQPPDRFNAALAVSISIGAQPAVCHWPVARYKAGTVTANGNCGGWDADQHFHY